jgi:hypothetical protein
MPIPAFGFDGFLPPPTGAPFTEFEDWDAIPAGHPCSMVETEDRLVTAFPSSLTRAVLFHQLEMYMYQARQHLDCVLMVVSGAFTTDTCDPRDIFLVLEAPGDRLEALPGPAQFVLDSLFDDRQKPFGDDETLTVYTGIVRAFPPDHRKWEATKAARSVHRFQASSPEDRMNMGYLEVLSCEEGSEDADALL